MLGLIALAAALRFYRLGEWPPGLYRDEAYNGLDALGVLRGEHSLFFTANNGREPFYIYLVALSIALFGPTVMALRLPAAVVGTLATLPVYALGRAWFGRPAGLIAAFLWAATFWPVHLGRIGLRAGLLAPLLALAFWFGTRAWRERKTGLWLLAGVVYGFSFYTYLAARFTPLILVLFAAYLILTGRRDRLWDGGRVLWFALGALVVVAPLAAVFIADPSLITGRAGQVSILSPAINGGNPVGALLGNIGRALGMYLWRGDDILRHNAWLAYDAAVPAGRPVFDWLMAAPFVVGLVWCVRHWRRPAATLLLIWQAVMLGPTILAEDAPHFLRAVGVLPGAVFFPAIGLALLWNWTRLSVGLRRGLVILLLTGSAALTLRDYTVYARQPDVGYLFESAAADLARAAGGDSVAGLAVFMDRRFPEGWPSVRFLLNDRAVATFSPDSGLLLPDEPAVIYAWPYGSLDFLPDIDPPALVEITTGPPARGDLEPEPYSLYTRYAISRPAAPSSAAATPFVAANFDNAFALADAAVELSAADELAVRLRWEPLAELLPDSPLPSTFIHVVGPEGMIGQADGPIDEGLWPGAALRPGLLIGRVHDLSLNRPYDPDTDSVQVGIYWADTGVRLPLLDARGNPVDDKLTIRPEP